MKLLFRLILCFYIASCSSYVKKMHREMDQGSRSRSIAKEKNEKFNFYRMHSNKKQRNNSKLNKTVIPAIKRKYVDNNKRYRADDFIDNLNEGSLWSGRGQRNFFFAKNRFKRAGDIITVNVMNELKKEISLELARAFPERSKKRTSKGARPVEEKKEEEKEDDRKVYDRISTVVGEEIGRDYLLLKGRKEVLHKKRKHFIEIQAMVARRDILEEDEVDSEDILESSVVVLR